MSRVLMVEDDSLFRRLIRMTLEAEGFEVEEAGDASGIVRRVQERDIDLVLLDLGLPGAVDGIDACRKLRGVEELASLPIVVVSGFSGAIDRKRARAAGADDYIAKPFDPIELLGAVRRFAGTKPV